MQLFVVDFLDHLTYICGMKYGVASMYSRAEATAEITDWILQGMRACRILDGICRVKYENNPGKLAARLQAAHIEKPPAKPKPQTP